MFQSFTVASRPEQGPPRLAALRAQMQAKQVDAFLVPRADAWQGEYVAPCDARLGWLTGFTGSAGFAAVTATEAGVFIDGRYRLQASPPAAIACRCAIRSPMFSPPSTGPKCNWPIGWASG
ncbi:aminopeptidase P [Ketogulonicigenium vulgare Y25]|nr:aminopeptidase P [Ketogulonicigenium vulgare Y25]